MSSRFISLSLPRHIAIAAIASAVLAACGGGGSGSGIVLPPVAGIPAPSPAPAPAPAPAPQPSPDPSAGLPHKLTGWASLPASFRQPGPTTGQFITAALGVTPPFVDGQPLPGFSALLKNDDGTWTAMPDNGYGSKSNSGDFVVGFYNVSIDFRTASNGTTVPGTVKVNSHVAFNDSKGFLKDGKGVDLKITADFANYQTVSGNNLVDSGKPVDPRIVSGRLLTGFDLDVESIARAKDGTYFVGEEFGPYILHFDKDGTLMSDPVPHPFLRSPSNPLVMNEGATATSLSSRGFESLAFNADKTRLYAVPEAAPSLASLRPVADDERYLNFFEFDPASMLYTGKNPVYRKDGPAKDNQIVIGDMTNIGGNRFVLIERDSLYGSKAVVKRLYMVDLDVKDADGVLKKTLLVDLLNISDPDDIGGPLANVANGKFSMPFDSVESVEVVDDYTLAVAIDTNFPTEDGRVPGKPDDTEIITIRFEQPLFKRAASKT